MATSLSLWSPQGDRIHDFVTKNFNGQWPAAGKTWIRLTTADWRNVTMRFEGFRNVFWDQAGPTVRMSFGDVDELEIIELPLDTICHAAPRNPFKLRLDTPYFLGECNLGAAKGCLCLVSLGERTDAYTFEDFVQDAVDPQLRLRTRDGRSILVFAACVADMRSPKWCPDPLLVLDAHGHPLRPGSRLRLTFDQGLPTVLVFHGWSSNAASTWLEGTSGQSLLRYDCKNLRRAEHVQLD